MPVESTVHQSTGGELHRGIDAFTTWRRGDGAGLAVAPLLTTLASAAPPGATGLTASARRFFARRRW